MRCAVLDIRTVTAAELARWEAAAEPERRARWQQFRRPEDRARSICADHLARTLLREAGAEEPAIRTGTNGKPYVPGGPAFNCSHSGNFVCCAVHGAAHEVPGVAAVEGRASGHIGLAVRPGPNRGFLCTGLTEQRARQMVGADAAGAVLGAAELLPAGAALRLCCGFPPGKLRSGDGPDVKNGAAHSLTTTGPSGGRRHIPAER